MTSSVHDLSDSSVADEPKSQSGRHVPALSAARLSHPGMTLPNERFGPPQELGAGNVVVPPAYPYSDPYCRSVFVSHDGVSYPQQPYGGLPMVHLQLSGPQQAGVLLPSDAVEEPVFVNAKQYHGILRRPQSRAKDKLVAKVVKLQKPYFHESRHQHAIKRARGCGGRFLNSKKNEKQRNKLLASV